MEGNASQNSTQFGGNGVGITARRQICATERKQIVCISSKLAGIGIEPVEGYILL